MFSVTGALLYVALSSGKNRCGGSAFAQCFSQIGDCVPDLDNAELFVNGFKVTQALLKGLVFCSVALIIFYVESDTETRICT